MTEDELRASHEAMRARMRTVLDTVKDEGTSIDMGSGMGAADFWVTVHGVEYFVTVTESAASKKRRGA